MAQGASTFPPHKNIKGDFMIEWLRLWWKRNVVDWDPKPESGMPHPPLNTPGGSAYTLLSGRTDIPIDWQRAREKVRREHLRGLYSEMERATMLTPDDSLYPFRWWMMEARRRLIHMDERVGSDEFLMMGTMDNPHKDALGWYKTKRVDVSLPLLKYYITMAE
jgi:hypothetical protein